MMTMNGRRSSPLREPDFIDDVVEQEEDPGRKSLGNFPSTLATAGAGHSDRGHRHGTQSSDAQSSNPQSSNLTRPHKRPHIHQVFFDGAEPRPITEARYHNDARPLSAYLDRKGEKDAARLVLDMEREMVRLRAENTRLWDDLIEELTRMVRANPHEYGPDAVRQAERVRKRN